MTNFFKHKMRRKSAGEIVGWVILGIIAVVGLAILFGFIIMWLWNWLMPALFGIATINYWQAVGIFILSKILLGGCGGGGGKRHSSCKHSKKGCDKESGGDFSRWKYYEKFWEEEGDQAFKAYVARRHGENEEELPEA